MSSPTKSMKQKESNYKPCARNQCVRYCKCSSTGYGIDLGPTERFVISIRLVSDWQRTEVVERHSLQTTLQARVIMSTGYSWR